MGIRSFLDNVFTSPNPIIDYRVDTSPLMLRGQYDPDRLPDWFGARQASWAGYEWDSDKARDAARKSITVFACATYLGDAVAEAQLTVESRQTGGEWDAATDGASKALQALVNRPNPYMEDAEFLSLLVFQMAIMGYAVVEKVRAGNGLPVELWPLRADWLVSPRGGATNYQYRVPGQQDVRLIPPEDLIWLPWRHDDRMERRGISPVTVAAREIGIDNELTNWLKAFLDAGGIPMYVMTHPEAIVDKATIEAMQESWRQKYGGLKAYGQIPYLHGGWQLQQVQGDVNTLAWPDLRDLTELKICSAFRVPPGLIGARHALQSGSLTSTDTEGDMSALQRYGAEPLRLRLAAGLGRALLPEFGLAHPQYRMAFDTSMVLALQEDTDALHTRVRADWSASLLTLNEARMAIKLDPLPQTQGDVFAIPFSTMLVPATSLAGFEELPAAIVASRTPETPALPASTNGRRYVDETRMSPQALEVRASIMARTRRDRQRLVEIGTRHIGRFLKEQGDRIADTVEKSAAAHETRDIEAIDWEEEYRLLDAVLRKFYMANGEAAFAGANLIVAAELTWTTTNPRILQLLEILGRRIVGIHETTRAAVSQVLADGMLQGQTLVELAAAVRTYVDETYKNRGLTIARTESQVAYNRSSALAYAESGEVQDVELSDNPDHTEWYAGAVDGLTCAERHGLITPLNMVDLHTEAEHPNGSLIVVPILSTPLGEA
jgi:HK97 family phage portal protein